MSDDREDDDDWYDDGGADYRTIEAELGYGDSAEALLRAFIKSVEHGEIPAKDQIAFVADSLKRLLDGKSGKGKRITSNEAFLLESSRTGKLKEYHVDRSIMTHMYFYQLANPKHDKLNSFDFWEDFADWLQESLRKAEPNSELLNWLDNIENRGRALRNRYRKFIKLNKS